LGLRGLCGLLPVTPRFVLLGFLLAVRRKPLRFLRGEIGSIQLGEFLQ